MNLEPGEALDAIIEQLDTLRHLTSLDFQQRNYYGCKECVKNILKRGHGIEELAFGMELSKTVVADHTNAVKK